MMEVSEEEKQLTGELQNLLDTTLRQAVEQAGNKPSFVAVHHGALIPTPADSDIVFENIFIGGEKLARDITWLKSNKVTHVVNTAQGKRFGQVDTDASFYDESGIQYYGVPGHDSIKFDIKKHFEESSAFIDQGNKIGKVYVHCHQGISRSTTIVLAYMMRYHNMTAVQALTQVLSKRIVLPNRGFIKHLAAYQLTLSADKH